MAITGLTYIYILLHIYHECHISTTYMLIYIYRHELNHKVRFINTSQWPQFTCIQWNALANSGWINICAYRLNTWVTCVSNEFQYTSSSAWQIDSSSVFGCIMMHICENTICFWGCTFITTYLMLTNGTGIWPITISRGIDSARAEPRNFGWKFHLQKFTRLEAVYASGAVKMEICTNPCNQHWLHICNIYI